MRVSVGASVTLIIVAGIAVYGIMSAEAAAPATGDPFASYIGKTCTGYIISTLNRDTFALAQNGSVVIHHEYVPRYAVGGAFEDGGWKTLEMKPGDYSGTIPTSDKGGHIFYKPLPDGKLAVEVRWDQWSPQSGTYNCGPAHDSKR